ncbi:unnamed protein product [Brugia pahangi]|uniref:Sm domain-containing protein n=1 Tax=Brugia pahangi TaxID=6280 RepID=A0A0N4T488_BRUPA|nr:unnamed protein product [Brugia pahangi]
MLPGLDVHTAKPFIDNRSIYLVILVVANSNDILTYSISVKIYDRSQYNVITVEDELVGTLTDFNMVLEDVVKYENTVDGKRVTKLDTILLNGNHITMLVPGGEGPEV